MIANIQEIKSYQPIEDETHYRLRLVKDNGMVQFNVYYKNDKDLYLEDLNQLVNFIGIPEIVEGVV